MANPPSESTAVETSICYRMAADRRLLGGQCESSECPHSGAVPATGVPDVPPCMLSGQHHTVIGLDKVRRVALMVNPDPSGSFNDQAWEAVSTIRAILRQQGEPMAVTVQTVFLADAADLGAAQKLFEAYYGERMPVTNYVIQPPCDGRGLAIEAWAVGTSHAKLKFDGAGLVTVAYDGLSWVYAAADRIDEGSAYDQAAAAFAALDKRLARAGASFNDVARIWLYQGEITALEGDIERYRELNRARTDFFSGVRFEANPLMQAGVGEVYPASTGIGTLGTGLATTCLALCTERDDVGLLSLENPLQTAAADYPRRYSAKSPKFSRAMAVRTGEFLTTWVSGTASIVDSETVHVGDVEKQTEQTLTNIENLISASNFERCGWADGGAELADLAKIRVYVKRPEDYEACRAVCEKRLGAIPAIYALADVCRPDLLVEIEGVAFSSIRGAAETGGEAC